MDKDVEEFNTEWQRHQIYLPDDDYDEVDEIDERLEKKRLADQRRVNRGGFFGTQ